MSSCTHTVDAVALKLPYLGTPFDMADASMRTLYYAKRSEALAEPVSKPYKTWYMGSSRNYGPFQVPQTSTAPE